MDSAQAQELAKSVIARKVGGWTSTHLLGAGKSAVVLAAENDGIKGAIKIFHPELVERYGKAVQLERVNRERSLIGRHHPNLVSILDGGECPDSGYLYVVMELLPFDNLQKQRDSIPPERIRPLISQLADAARFLEDLALVHRDIKPENVAVSPDFERLVLLDLGVIRPFAAPGLTDVDQRAFIGTLRYSSPEFLMRTEQDSPEGWRALTFYQIGAVLHDLLTKRLLFADSSEPYARLVDAVRTQVPEIVGGDVDLVNLARRALVKDPLARLELVRWEDFSPAPKQSEDLNALIQQIKLRQALARTTNGAQQMPEGRRLAEARGRLEQVSSEVGTRVSAVLSAQTYFPPRSMHPAVHASESLVSIVVAFEKDEGRGLSGFLMTECRLTEKSYVGDESIFTCDFGAILSSNAEPPQSLGTDVKQVFAGTKQELLSGSVLADLYMKALAAAYRAIDMGMYKNGAADAAIEV